MGPMCEERDGVIVRQSQSAKNALHAHSSLTRPTRRKVDKWKIMSGGAAWHFRSLVWARLLAIQGQFTVARETHHPA